MKISLKWLSDFVDVIEYFQRPEVLGDLLTKAGLEVEEITQKSKDLQSVVTGLILEKAKHPNADKLSLCRVTTGEGVVHQIVCGAQNHNTGDKVVVALPGAVLPGNFVIKSAVVRGVESGGMLCSLKELGLAKESNGIEILPADAPIGKAYAEYKGLDDVTFELKVTPNRADCLSHYGLAREVACLIGRDLKNLNLDLKEASGSTQDQMKLDVRSELCTRYAGRFLSGVKVGPSPAWLSQRLESVGMNSINNIVDVTNYVMMELGQPLHAFDADLVKGRTIVVEKAKPEELFKTLDGTEIKLSGEELMIRDAEKPVAMAGVVGGQNSGVSESTKNIFLEAAHFNASAVRKASRLHGVNTDSGYRFSRGVDPENTFRAMNRAAQLILQVAGGEAFSKAYDHNPKPFQAKTVEVSVDTVSQRLGYKAEAAKFENFMSRMGCQIEKKGEAGVYAIHPPSYRFDLEQEVDFIEEYARLNGYDKIPETLPTQKLEPQNHDPKYFFERKLAEVMRGFGFHQAMNMCFAGDETQNKFIGSLSDYAASGLPTTETPVKLLNPLGADQNILRQTLSFGLYQNLHHNFHQGLEKGRLFETGSVFSTDEKGDYKEYRRMGAVLWGEPGDLWKSNANVPLVFQLKAAAEALLVQLKIKSYSWQVQTDRSLVPEFLHQRQYAQLVVEGESVGFIGTLHPVILENDKIRVPAALMELNLEQLLKNQPRLSKVEKFPRFPKVQRDLALLMPQTLAAGDVRKEILKVGQPLVTEVQVFDLYSGDKLAVGQKSVAYRLSFQDPAGTLQDQVVSQSLSQIVDSLHKKFSISPR